MTEMMSPPSWDKLELQAKPLEIPSGETCITCSDQGRRAVITQVLPDGYTAIVQSETGTETVDISLVPASVGDTILIHAQTALTKIEE